MIELGTIREPGPADRHTSGIAMDVMLSIHVPAEKALADGMIGVLIANHSTMKWSDIVYSDFKSDGTIDYYHIPGGGRGYGGKALERNPYGSDTKHRDHFHIDWVDFTLKNDGAEFLRNPYKWSDAARKTGFEAALVTAFKAMPSASSMTSGPRWPSGWWKVVDGGGTYFYKFAVDGSIAWQADAPANARAAVGRAGNKGTFKVTAGDTLQITWNKSGGAQTVETFKQGSSPKEMDGKSNRFGPLVAKRIE
jgi:hypothetical protein